MNSDSIKMEEESAASISGVGSECNAQPVVEVVSSLRATAPVFTSARAMNSQLVSAPTFTTTQTNGSQQGTHPTVDNNAQVRPSQQPAAPAFTPIVYATASGISYVMDEPPAPLLMPPVSLYCPHLDTLLQPVPEQGFNVYDSCANCGADGDNWVCLTCYMVFCSRYVRQHMIRHARVTGHDLSLSYMDVSVWCHGCVTYLQNPVLRPYRNIVHQLKYGVDVPPGE